MSLKGSVSFFLIIFTVSLASAILPEISYSGAQPWAGKVRPGFMTGNSDVGTDVYLDILMPFKGNEQHLFFFNPNFRFDDNDGNEQNIGLGYRRFVSGSQFILGGNAYFDTMKSENGHRYKQWGIGVELLSQWLDLRANYYNVFGDTKNILGGSSSGSGYYFQGNSLLVSGGLDIEEALDGYDVEFSVLIPGLSDLMETRVAATYYRFDANYGNDPDGWRGRVEFRPVQALNLSVEHRNDDLRGKDTFFGGFIELPFAIENMFAGKNPFEGAGNLLAFGKGVRAFEERMTDKVVRDRHIVAIRNQTKTGGNQSEIDNKMIFVNQDNEDPEGGEGTYENPYTDLASLRDDEHFVEGAWIYVFSSDENADTYENTTFTMLDGQVLWGEGYEHPDYDLGGGPMPILEGTGGVRQDSLILRDSDPVIILADNNEVMGFTIQNGDHGVFGRNIKGASIHDNTIRWNGIINSGIHIENSWSPSDITGESLAFNITNNLVLDNAGSGIYLDNNIDGSAAVEDFSIYTTVAGNTIQGNSWYGIYVRNNLVTDGVAASVDNVTFRSTFSENVIGGEGRGEENGYHGIVVGGMIMTEGETSPVSNSSIINYFSDNQIVVKDQGILRDSKFSESLYPFAPDVPTETDAINFPETLLISSTGTDSGLSNVSIENTFTDNILSGGDSADDGIVFDYERSGLSMNIRTWEATSAINGATIANTFTGNTITGFLGDGIYFPGLYIQAPYLEGSSVTDANIVNVLTANTVTDNGRYGIYNWRNEIDSYKGAVSNSGLSDTYTGNTVSRNGYTGIYLDSDFTGGADTSMQYAFTNNTISDNGNMGLYLYIDPSDVELIDKTLFLQGNSITGNADYGIELYVNGTDADDFQGDFGGGLLSSTGGNTFSGNGKYDISHRGESNMEVWALNNSWTNNSDPESTIFDKNDPFGGGDIITSEPEE